MTWCEPTPVLLVFGPKRKKIPKTAPTAADYVFRRCELSNLSGNMVVILPKCHPECDFGILQGLKIKDHVDCFRFSWTI